MKLSTKIIIAVGALAIAGTAGYGYREYNRISARVYETEKQTVAVRVQEQASSILSPEDFSGTDGAAQARAFEKFFDNIQTSDLFRIKAWNKEFVVVWSNLPETIGKRFPNNHEVKEALEGEIEFELKAAGKKEQVSERNYTNFSETYVPIKDAQGEVMGVIEAYQRTVKPQKNIQSEFNGLLLVLIPSVLVGFAALAFIIRLLIKI